MAARRRFACLLALAAGLALAGSEAAAQTLRGEIERLAERHGFALDGAELVGTHPVAPAGEDADASIARLLGRYDYVLLRDRGGRIVRLTIVGPHAARMESPRSRVVPTQRRGGEHHVEGTVTGPNGRPVSLRLLIDTGASTVVLAQTEAVGLGFALDRLERVAIQTANGLVEGRMATLAEVAVAGAAARDVPVTFLPDGHLGDKRLLGMSFLGRFVLTIDDSRGLVTLTPRN